MTTIEGILETINRSVLSPLISLLFVLATVLFLWGVTNYVVGNRGDATRLERGKKIMIWGIVGMAIMASAWGIVNILRRFFGT